jgi:hypothetical protein
MGACFLGSGLVQAERKADLSQQKQVPVINAGTRFREELLNYQIIEQ